MDEAALQGGGSGSAGEPMTISVEDLVSEAKAMVPPHGAFSIKDFADATGLGREACVTFLESKVSVGKLESAKFPTVTGGPAWYYWPAKNPKASKKARRTNRTQRL